MAPTASAERAQRLGARVAERPHRFFDIADLDVQLSARVTALLQLTDRSAGTLREALLAVETQPVIVRQLELGVLPGPFQVRFPTERVVVELLRAIHVAYGENEMHYAIVSPATGICHLAGSRNGRPRSWARLRRAEPFPPVTTGARISREAGAAIGEHVHEQESAVSDRAHPPGSVEIGADSAASTVQMLQRKAGNAAVARLLDRRPPGGRVLQRQQPATAQAAATGSELKNLLRARNGLLTWADYKGTKPAGDKHLALTVTNIQTSIGGRRPAPGRPVLPDLDPVAGGFKLRDNITMEIVFDSQKSWKDPALASNIDQLILDHELGHYNITALFARDMFIDIMQLKANTYSSVADGQNDVASVFTRYQTALAKAQAAYESETRHGAPTVLSIGPPTKNTDQTAWEGFIKKAFETERTPRTVSPDGKAYKLRLLDILTQAGKI